ncbi:MAG TPA: ribosome-associated translation inhibitor RaiA [Gammaproteobacteria bacterium]|nr:ribosome-associated translation inhibitor RaiA [Gammaproteobacteria bacterium]
MQINVTGQHLDLTDSLRDYVTTKLTKLERHIDTVTNVHVILSVEKQRQKAEATLHINGANLFAEAQDENMYAAIDALIDKLDRQVKKHKEKRSDHHRGSSSALQASLQEEAPQE